MRRGHLERLSPICPRCRRADGAAEPLALQRVLREEGPHVVQGALGCPACLMEFPIVDGVPVIHADLRAYVAQHVLDVLWRDDLDPLLESLLGDCCGPGSAMDVTRQHVSSYAWDHYADLDPAEGTPGPHDPAPGALRRVLARALTLAGDVGPGPIVDLGCGVGRTTFELAARADLVLGVDLHFAMLRVAARALRQGVVRYPRRRVGAVYDVREVAVDFPQAEHVDFWACDALALPFAPRRFSFAASLNVLDCLADPPGHLVELQRVLRPGGRAVLATPYDWSPAATPFESWLGGHSQRSEQTGAAEPALRRLIGGAFPGAAAGLRIVAEEDVPWQVRLHDRHVARYRSHLLVLEAQDGAQDGAAP